MPSATMTARTSVRDTGHECRYVFSVVAGVPPAVEPGVSPGGLSTGLCLAASGLPARIRAARCRPLRQPRWPLLQRLEDLNRDECPVNPRTGMSALRTQTRSDTATPGAGSALGEGSGWAARAGNFTAWLCCIIGPLVLSELFDG